MHRADQLRPELRSVCRFLGNRQRGHMVRPTPLACRSGILADLADPRGRN